MNFPKSYNDFIKSKTFNYADGDYYSEEQLATPIMQLSDVQKMIDHYFVKDKFKPGETIYGIHRSLNKNSIYKYIILGTIEDKFIVSREISICKNIQDYLILLSTDNAREKGLIELIDTKDTFQFPEEAPMLVIYPEYFPKSYKEFIRQNMYGYDNDDSAINTPVIDVSDVEKMINYYFNPNNQE